MVYNEGESVWAVWEGKRWAATVMTRNHDHNSGYDVRFTWDNSIGHNIPDSRLSKLTAKVATPKKKGFSKVCTHVSCSTKSYAGGLCRKHGVKTTCSNVECTTNALQGKLKCAKHGGRGFCVAEGCALPNSANGYACHRHSTKCVGMGAGAVCTTSARSVDSGRNRITVKWGGDEQALPTQLTLAQARPLFCDERDLVGETVLVMSKHNRKKGLKDYLYTGVIDSFEPSVTGGKWGVRFPMDDTLVSQTAVQLLNGLTTALQYPQIIKDNAMVQITCGKKAAPPRVQAFTRRY